VWQRCDSTGASCAEIAGATSATYSVVAPDDVGQRLRVIVTATNPDGSFAIASLLTPVVS
jgi:hypothetical protein